MRHGYMYQGGFERNYASLRPGTSTYKTSDGRVHELPEWPPEVTGVRVGYMEKRGKKFYAVRVQFEDHDVVLGRPTTIDHLRHMGGRRFTAEPTVVTDDLASALLDDIIELNPEQSGDLALLLNRVNQVRRAARVEG